jgi:NhaP-type Na+/H+ or K+/H+ antiporter
VTTNQVLLGVGLILALAVGSQVIASRLRIPALIILPPAGFIAGAITTDVGPPIAYSSWDEARGSMLQLLPAGDLAPPLALTAITSSG